MMIKNTTVCVQKLSSRCRVVISNKRLQLLLYKTTGLKVYSCLPTNCGDLVTVEANKG